MLSVAWTAFAATLLLLCARTTVGTASNVSAPISIPPSQYFSGDDGAWSTFIVEVGSPAQSVYLLPGTSAFAGTTVWVVLSEGCWEANPGLPDCTSARGGVFTRNASTSWSTERLPGGGLLQLQTYEENFLDLSGAGYYGFDTVKLGISGQSLPTLQNQLVAGFATDNYFLGSLGLSPLSFNISDLDSPVPSVLGVLRNESIVPSSSWAYTAGAAYHEPQAYGSLTFGGYDTAQYDTSNMLVDIPFSGDTSRDLQVSLQSITYDTIGSTPLLTDSINVFIDSLVTQIWLPLTVCQSFEKAFNLTWDSDTELYLIDNDVYNTILAQNPEFTFTLASSGGSTVDIVLPYGAFDLNVTAPITNATSRYFPLKRAQNSTQYTLGRVFLQEAYVIADYDRQNFTVAQAEFPSSSTPQNLVPICAPGDDAACKTGHEGLSSGEIAGVVIGAVSAVLIIALAAWWIFRRRRRAREARKQAEDASMAANVDEKRDLQQAGPLSPGAELESQGAAKYEMDRGQGARSELAGDGKKHEIGGGEFRPELAGDTDKKHEMTAEHTRHEMGAGEVAAFELEAPLK